MDESFLMTSANIDCWKGFIALADMREAMSDYGHRLNLQYHTDFKDAVLHDDLPLNLEDPAVQAFLELIDAAEDPGTESISSIYTCLTLWNTRAERAGLHAFDSKPMTSLMETRLNGGWDELDRLVSFCCSGTMTRYLERVGAIYQEDDKGLGGDTCYRLQVITDSRETQSKCFEWFALASNASDMVKLIGKILNGEHTVEISPGVPAKLEMFTVVKNEKQSMLLPIVNMNGGIVPAWNACHFVREDMPLLRALAGLAPKETMYRLKGAQITQDLGL